MVAATDCKAELTELMDEFWEILWMIQDNGIPEDNDAYDAFWDDINTKMAHLRERYDIELPMDN